MRRWHCGWFGSAINLGYLRSGTSLVSQDLISDSDDGDEFEWDSDGDREAISLNAAGPSAHQASRNLDAPGSSTLVRLVSEGKCVN